jgi:hypothetical protein
VPTPVCHDSQHQRQGYLKVFKTTLRGARCRNSEKGVDFQQFCAGLENQKQKQVPENFCCRTDSVVWPEFLAINETFSICLILNIDRFFSFLI